MGCGSSRQEVRANTGAKQADDECNAALAAHLSSVLGIKQESADVTNYCNALRSVGCDSPDDLNSIAVEELARNPFNFKRLHLQKVAHSRKIVADAVRIDRSNVEATQIDDECSAALASHLSSILCIKAASADVALYVGRLRSQGFDTKEDIDNMPVETLAASPFSFKQGHLLKMARAWKSKEEEPKLSKREDVAQLQWGQGYRQRQELPREYSKVPSQVELGLSKVRGQCSICGVDVLDSEPRLKDTATGLYQHEECSTRNFNVPNAAARSAQPHVRGLMNERPAEAALTQEQVDARPTNIRDLAITEAKLNATAAIEEAHAEVAAIMAAADAARAGVQRQAEAELAQAQVAAAAQETHAEVAAIMAAADAARAKVISDAKQQADAAVAQARADAAKIKALKAQTSRTTKIANTTDLDQGTASGSEATMSLSTSASASVSASASALVSASASSRTPSNHGFTTRKPILPAGPKTKPLLPDGKHAFLSYQWDVQEQVKTIKEMLNRRKVKCWMDIDGGMKSDIYDSMAEGVQGAACVICFMTQAYQDSANCKLELKFAQQSGVPIIPVMMQPNFAAKGWLGILTSGSVWTPMYESSSVPDGIDKLIAQAQHLVPGMRGEDVSDTMSEASGDGSSFDVGGWGEEIFSLAEMREELDRLREETVPSAGANRRSSKTVGKGGVPLCPLPAMVPTLPQGIFVTEKMQSVLDAVLSDTSTPQIGFCGMGGIGKTTVSCWVARSDDVRAKFDTVAWIPLGQTPVLNSCINLLHLQLTGTPLPEGVPLDQTQELLKYAFLNQSVLLILDDCWDANVASPFNWIDQNTNSKVLISSRIRDVLDGGVIIDVNAPSKSDAVKMLLSTAGMDVNALQGYNEVGHVAELCKRLPLTIGVAGKLIRQLANGSSMADASDWADVVSLLEDELNDSDGSMSVEESVIRASIKAIPQKLRKQVSLLFMGFALVPEDTFVPLAVLGMIFSACNSAPQNGGSAAAATTTTAAAAGKPLSRLQIRRYLKVLIDRSLVLGTVDRPQLHDVMLDYVQKQLTGETYKGAQRLLVDALRKGDRSRSTPTGKYTENCVKHHIKESYDEAWGVGKQAISWIEDHDSGIQDVIAASAASILPAEELAKEAERAEMWWQAALRWSALGFSIKAESSDLAASGKYFTLAVNASAKVDVVANTASVGPGGTASFTKNEFDLFELYTLSHILKQWDPALLQTFGKRYGQAAASEAGLSRPLLRYSAEMTLTWFTALLSGDPQKYADGNWVLSKIVLEICDENTESYALSTDNDRENAKPLLNWTLMMGGESIFNSPGFSWDCFGGW